MKSETQKTNVEPSEVWAEIMHDDWAHERRGDLSLNPRQHPLVRQVLRLGVRHDYADVLAEGAGEVLGWYGLQGEYLELDEEEVLEVRRALLAIGGRVQTEEMVRLSREPDPLLAGISYREWTVEELARFKKRFVEGLRRLRTGDGCLPRPPRLAFSKNERSRGRHVCYAGSSFFRLAVSTL